jgi:hypothetical protein
MQIPILNQSDRDKLATVITAQRARSYDLPLTDESMTDPKRFEVDTLRFFQSHGERYGIKDLIPVSSGLVDGLAIDLDGNSILVEVKYRLGWKTSCVAINQIQRFLHHKIYEDLQVPKPTHALIVFEKFSDRDWKEIYSKTGMQKGWAGFYYSHQYIHQSIAVDIVQFDGSKLRIASI